MNVQCKMYTAIRDISSVGALPSGHNTFNEWANECQLIYLECSIAVNKPTVVHISKKS